MTDKMRDFVKGLALGLTGAPLPYTGTAEPVAYLYNGYRLPPLPNRDKAQYPYATIDSTATMTKITVTLTLRKSWRQDIQMSAGDLPTDAIWRQPGDILYQLTKSGYYPTFGSITATDWGEGVEVTESKWIRATSVRWSNTDIVSQGSISHDAGELILAASEPEPVYE